MPLRHKESVIRDGATLASCSGCCELTLSIAACSVEFESQPLYFSEREFPEPRDTVSSVLTLHYPDKTRFPLENEDVLQDEAF